MDGNYAMYLSTLSKEALQNEKTSLENKIKANIAETSTSFNERLIREKQQENDECRRSIKKIKELLEVFVIQEAAAKEAASASTEQ